MGAQRILTIAMAVHDDYAGLWGTIQAIRNHYPAETLRRLQFLVGDNNPRSHQAQAIREYMTKKFNQAECPGYYMSIEPRKSTSLRNLLVHAADTEYVLVIDSHINIRGIDKLIAFLDAADATPDLFAGILVDEQGGVVATHQNPGLRGGMFGTWGIYPQTPELPYDQMEPFEIPLHGCGLFLTRRDDWLGFPIAFRHFGGEEGYIQEKYRQHGRKAWCLPFLRWDHRFGHPGGTSYPLTHEGKFWNHLVGWAELGLPLEIVHKYFGSRVLPGPRAELVREFNKLNIQPISRPSPDYQPFLGYPIRINDMDPKESEDYREFEKLIFAH